MDRMAWRVVPVAVALVLAAGCASNVPEGTRFASMDFPQFTEAVIANGSPELARQFGATRAAICQATLHGEIGPCINTSLADSVFSSRARRTAHDPQNRLAPAFDNWCAAHGGQAKPTLPKSFDQPAYYRTIYFSDFGTAVSKLKITRGQGTSVRQTENPSGRQCFLGSSSVGLITAVVFLGLDEQGQYRESVLALLYDEKDLMTFSQSGQERRTGNGETK